MSMQRNCEEILSNFEKKNCKNFREHKVMKDELGLNDISQILHELVLYNLYVA